jgi:hypothetical protein
MRRDLDSLVRKIREELRAEGPDGAGFSDFFIQEQINSALGDLADIFPIRDTIELVTTAGQNTYDLTQLIPQGTVVENVIKITYDGRDIRGKTLDEYTALVNKTEGAVSGWFMWGNTLTLIGEVEEAPLTLWIHRAPKPLQDKGDEPETPYYADNAITNYVIAACYRESRDYERASFHFNIFQRDRNILLNRGIPQQQRDHGIRMRDTYWEAEGTPIVRKTDTNPGGR